MRTGASYTIGRLCAVGTKPLCLFAANNFLTAQTAQNLAVAFLASALALIGVGAGPHRRFYARYFAAEASVNGFAFYLYATSVALLAVFGCAVVCAIALYFTRSPALSVAAILFFVSEKLADELLRLRLFERNFAAWGRASVARGLLQLSGLGCLLVSYGHSTPSWLLAIALSVANFVVFVPQLPPRLWSGVRPDRLRAACWLVRRALHSLLDNWMLWFIALLGSAVAYLDRVVALVIDKTILPLFMLVVMCFSVVQMAVDFYYVSRYRRDFLEGRVWIGDVFSKSQFLRSIGAGFALASIGCTVVLWLSRNGATFPLGYVVAIAALQLSIAIAAIPMEILYWSHKLHRILYIEIAFWVLFACAALGARLLSLPAMGIFALAVACAITRLALYLRIAARAMPAPLNPTSMTT